MPKSLSVSPELSQNSGHKRARGSKTTWSQFAAMVEWLENATNFNLIVGAATSTMKTGTVAGAKLTKNSGYADLVVFVNERCPNSNWDMKSAECRLRAYIKRFKDTKRAQLSPEGAKYCIGPEDHAKGNHTIEAKLDGDCPNFKRMDVLFGGRQNVNPACVLVPERPRRASTNSAAVDEEAEEVVSSDGEDFVEDDDDGDAEEGVEEDAYEEEDEGDSGEDYDVATQHHDDQAVAAQVLTSMANSRSTNTAGNKTKKTAVAPASSATPSPPAPVSSVSTTSAVNDRPPAAPKARQNKKPKKGDDKGVLLPSDLRDKCAETVAAASSAVELTAKIAEMKNSGTGKGRKDFSTTYAESKNKEIDLAREKFEFEKDNQDARTGAAHRQETRNVIIAEMIRKGANGSDIKDLLALLL